MVSSAEIDGFVAQSELDGHSIRMIRAEPPIEPRDYVLSNGIVDPLRVFDLKRSGATMILNQLHRHSPRLADLCRALEAAFTCQVQANVYLTPPAAQGFPAHYDSHDVFVLQVEGNKSWSLYSAPMHLAYRGERFRRGAFERGEPTQAYTLNAGDALYVPRGRMHDAVGGEEEPSLHITVGLIAKTWSDLVLEAVAAVALKDEGFRHGLPPGFARQDFERQAMRATFAELRERLVARMDMDAALDTLARDFVVSRRPRPPAGPDDRAKAVETDTPLRLRPHLVCRLAEHDKELILYGNGRKLSWSKDCRHALMRMTAGGTLTARDLADPLTETVALDVARRLVDAGLAEIP